jgi:hypothetical protein
MDPPEIRGRILLKIQGKLYDVKRLKKGKEEHLLEVADIETKEEGVFIIKSLRLLEVMDNLPREIKEKKTKKFLLLDADDGTWQICDNMKVKES